MVTKKIKKVGCDLFFIYDKWMVKWIFPWVWKIIQKGESKSNMREKKKWEKKKAHETYENLTIQATS